MLKSNFSQLLEHRSFVKFWLARLFGTTGNQMLMVALAWHMYDLTSSPWDLGLVGLFQFLPAFLMALPAGHIVDRFHRGRIYSACMLVQGLVALVLVLGTQGNFVTRDLVLFLSVMLGIARSFQMPVQQSLTPLLVPKPLLQSAIALSSSGIQIAIIAGRYDLQLRRRACLHNICSLAVAILFIDTCHEVQANSSCAYRHEYGVSISWRIFLA